MNEWKKQKELGFKECIEVFQVKDRMRDGEGHSCEEEHFEPGVYMGTALQGEVPDLEE